jgi:hypothetical protein
VGVAVGLIEAMERDLGSSAPEVLAAKEQFEADFEAEYVAEYDDDDGEIEPEIAPEPVVGPLVLSAVADLPQERSPIPSAPPPGSDDGEWVWED